MARDDDSGIKMSRKIRAALKRRQREFVGHGPNEDKKHKALMPGSQNRKKGYGMVRGKAR